MAEQKSKKSVSSKSIHSRRVQKSAVMNRKFVKSPKSTQKKTEPKAEPVKKIDSIKKPTPSTPKQTPRIITATPATKSPKLKSASLSPKEIKQKAIEKSLKDFDKRESLREQTQSIKQATKARRILFVMIAATACIAIIGTVAYFSIPKLSYTVFAMQAPFSPTFPSSLPDGYRLTSSNLDDNNRLTTLFVNRNNNQESFSMIQEQSSWTSANLENHLRSEWGNNYATLEQFGLRIFYTTEKGTIRARWVSGGILYSFNSGTKAITIRNIADIAISAR